MSFEELGSNLFFTEEQGNKDRISSGNKENTGEMHCLIRGTG